MKGIKIAIVGVGNCASALVQGIHHYRGKDEDSAVGLMHWDIGGYRPYDIEGVAALGVDHRKGGKDPCEAIFAPPNCTAVFCPDVPRSGVSVDMGRVLDGVSAHMLQYDSDHTFVPADAHEPSPGEVVRILRESGA